MVWGRWSMSRRLSGDGIGGQGTPLRLSSGHRPSRVVLLGRPDSRSRLLRLGASVVIGDFDADLASILAFAVQGVPLVALATAGYNNAVEVDPGLTNELRLLVIVKHRDFQLVVVRAIVHVEPDLLVPVMQEPWLDEGG